MPSNVRVEVSFQSPVVIAGETLSATITFRNIASAVKDKNVTTSANRGRPLSSVPPKSPGINDTNQEKKHNNGQTESSDEAWYSGRRLSMQIASTFRDLYLSSNNSVDSGPLPSRQASMRTKNTRSGVLHGDGSESLLMGFAQVQGFFQLDDSMVETEEFEHIRTQGVVVTRQGLEYGHDSKNGFFKGITSGINLLLQGTESSDNNSKGTSSANDFPIFSTPQTLLFVDMKLLPGESRSFSYNLDLPINLPASCRGKCIKVFYNMAVGSQKLDVNGSPNPKIILAPFRVFPYISKTGEQPIHDLRTPVVMKKDLAIVQTISYNATKHRDLHHKSNDVNFINKNHSLASTSVSTSSITEIQGELKAYAQDLLSASSGKSPDLQRVLSKQSSISTPTNAKENLEYFIKYHYHESYKPLKSNFDIGDANKRIASLSLSKPVFRVGEDLVVNIDFSKAVFKCYHVTISLETTESVDSTIAKKPPNEITAYSRRIFAQTALSNFSALSTHFEFTIPSTSSPQFTTSCISLQWSLKIDFITSPTDSILIPLPTKWHNDDRGDYIVANPILENCDTFTCRIPLNVFATNKDIGALIDHSTTTRRWLI